MKFLSFLASRIGKALVVVLGVMPNLVLKPIKQPIELIRRPIAANPTRPVPVADVSVSPSPGTPGEGRGEGRFEFFILRFAFCIHLSQGMQNIKRKTKNGETARPSPPPSPGVPGEGGGRSRFDSRDRA